MVIYMVAYRFITGKRFYRDSACQQKVMECCTSNQAALKLIDVAVQTMKDVSWDPGSPELSKRKDRRARSILPRDIYKYNDVNE